jgi:hypothetical protein
VKMLCTNSFSTMPPTHRYLKYGRRECIAQPQPHRTATLRPALDPQSIAMNEKDQESVIDASGKSKTRRSLKAQKLNIVQYSKEEIEKYSKCSVCLETCPLNCITMLSCAHMMCIKYVLTHPAVLDRATHADMVHRCLTQAFRLAITHEQHYPPKCCQIIQHEQHLCFIKPSVLRKYQKVAKEYDHPKKLYCYSCSRLISFVNHGEHYATCPDSKQLTCRNCKRRHHAPKPCKPEQEILDLLEKWKRVRCYKCGHGMSPAANI